MAVLILTEKPSVGQAIARAIGVTGRKDGYLEGAGYLVSWCVGHLVELAAADRYDPRYSKWTREDLPIVPEPWQFAVSPATKKQFDIVKGLMERPDVTELIEATDAGREGELIFRLVYHQAGCKKPFKRLWISSMEDSAIREGFQNLRPGENYDALYEAALCRAKADWLVGINATRLFTTLYRGKTLNVGRVMTPTLALLTEREKAAADFKKEKFYTVELDCGTFRAAGGRFSSKTEAEKLRKSCLGKPVTVQAAERQEKTEKPPKLYDLTTLQRETPAPLPELSQGQKLTAEGALLKEGTTRPPKRYTEDSLLLAMQNAGAEEFAQIGGVERTGLGTPATRAGVIEKLVKGGFVERKNRLLVPTVRGMELTKVLPDSVKSAKLTAEWEAALKEVERGNRLPEDFLKGITDMVCGLVKSYEGISVGTGSLSGTDREEIGRCPRCGKPVYEGKKSFYCSAYKDEAPCGFALWKDNPYFRSKRKELTKTTAAALLKNGRVKMTGLYSEKKGILYDATIVLDDTGGKYVNFKLEFDQKK